MPFSQVYDAIRTGVVDGQENSWSNIYSRDIHALHKNFTELDHSFQGYMVITSQDFWEDLPDDIRSELTEILAEVTEEVKPDGGRAIRKATARRWRQQKVSRSLNRHRVMSSCGVTP